MASSRSPSSSRSSRRAGSEAAPGIAAPGAIGPRAIPAHFVEVPPNAHKTLSALREMGYGSVESVMDLVDNSIDAGAERVAVQVRLAGPRTTENTGIVIDVLDDGKGMDRETLAQALRLGSETERTEQDLGKYGMGLVTASLSMAQTIYVLTRQQGQQAYEANFDMGAIRQHNKFLVTLAPVGDSRKVVDVLGDRGTLVRLSHIDRINDTNVQRFAATLRLRMGEVYRNFLAGPRGLKLSVNRQLVRALDPLMRDHPQTRVLHEAELSVAGVAFRLTAVELPDLGTLGDQEAGIYPHNSGFYVLRNGRQIIGGETFGFYRHHHAYSHFRAEVAFGGDADPLFHVDVKKSTIHPDERLLEKIRAETERYIVAVGRAGRDRPSAPPVKLKLEHSTDVINQRLALVTGTATGTEARPVAEPKPGVAREPADTMEETPPTPAPAAEQAEEQAATGPQPRVRFTEYEADPMTLFEDVSRDGQRLIRINVNHPFARLVAKARHKFANNMLTYVVYAVAEAAKARHGAEATKAFSTTLATILGVPAEPPEP